MKIDRHMAKLLKEGTAVYVSTSSKDGIPNTSLKGIVKVEPKGYIYFLDLFSAKTRRNLEANKNVSITVTDIDAFDGYQFKGRAELIKSGRLFEALSKKWSTLSANLVIDRIIRNIKRGYSHGRHELHLPRPKCLVKVKVNQAYDLCPKWIKEIKKMVH